MGQTRPRQDTASVTAARRPLRERIRTLYERHPTGAPSGEPPERDAGATLAPPEDVLWMSQQTGASPRAIYDWCSGAKRGSLAARMFLRRLEEMESEAARAGGRGG